MKEETFFIDICRPRCSCKSWRPTCYWREVGATQAAINIREKMAYGAQRRENKYCRELDFTRRAWQGALMSFQERSGGMAADGRIPGTLKCLTPSGQMNRQSPERCSVHVRPPHWGQRGKANVRELHPFTESLVCVFKSWSKVHLQLSLRVTVLKLRESPTGSIMWAGNSRAAHTEVVYVCYSSRPICGEKMKKIAIPPGSAQQKHLLECMEFQIQEHFCYIAGHKIRF